MIVAPNWLGDAVMALPAIADVRSARRNASLAVAARPSVAPLFALVPGVDEVIAIPRRGAAPLAGYDTAILLPNSFHSAMSVARAGVRESWGYRTDWRGLLLTRAVDRAPAGVHQIDCYQRLVASLGFANGSSTPRLEIPAAARDAGTALLREAGWDGRTPRVPLRTSAIAGSAITASPSQFGATITRRSTMV